VQQPEQKQPKVQRLSPFRMMNYLFVGLGVSLVYGLSGSGLLWYLGSKSEAQLFFAAYTTSFKTIVALGLSLGTAFIVYLCQNTLPQTIEKAFTESQLAETDYAYYKRRFGSQWLSIEFSAEFIIVGFIIFTYCQFPLSRRGEVLMIIAACAQYALGVYIGRKLGYAGMMLHSLLDAKITRNLFKKRELDSINTYVHVASTLTVIFAYIHTIGYFQGPFLYGSMFGQSIKPFLLIPIIIATPVLLIFNFYPRAVLRKVYSKSIDVEIKGLQKVLQDEGLTPLEKRSYLIEFNKMCRDELRYSLQLTLSDLPIGITILFMLLQPLLKR
jgi:hypothetical protein